MLVYARLPTPTFAKMPAIVTKTELNGVCLNNHELKLDKKDSGRQWLY